LNTRFSNLKTRVLLHKVLFCMLLRGTIWKHVFNILDVDTYKIYMYVIVAACFNIRSVFRLLYITFMNMPVDIIN